jgi:hypothetical protein
MTLGKGPPMRKKALKSFSKGGKIAVVYRKRHVCGTILIKYPIDLDYHAFHKSKRRES